MAAYPTSFQLEDRWIVVGPIGDAPGMSQVFEVENQGRRAVIKVVEKLPGAERELLVEDLGDCRNIVPFDEVLETESTIIIRMPKAEKSLNRHLQDSAGPLAEAEVVAVLTNLAVALADCGRIVVHRDIKPQNVLLLGGDWCLSDFGIARYAEAATASGTRKGWRSPPWNAPERWEGRRATIKSDVYSLGVVAYQLVTGELPFKGPDFYEQHRQENPTPLAAASPLLRALIVEMLAKSPDARPTPEQILDRLARINSRSASPAVARLQGLAAHHIEQASEADAQAARAQIQKEQRQLLASSGASMLKDLLRPLTEDTAGLPGVRQGTFSGGEYVQLGPARLAITKPESARASQTLPFDVVLYASIVVGNASNQQSWAGRSHSLWYCDAQVEGEYHWFETAFHAIAGPGGGVKRKLGGDSTIWVEPYDRSPDDRDAAYAVSPVVHTEQVARPFIALVGNEAEAFIERWLSWFADAADGRLAKPMMLPEGNTLSSWRR